MIKSSMQAKKSSPDDYYDILQSPVGTLFLVFSSSYLIDISFEKPFHIVLRQTKYSAGAKRELEEYFCGIRTDFTLKTAFSEGTDFEKEVWAALRHIPYGETRTYKWLAEIIGNPHASRAVGNALSKNPLPIIYPCHRIIEADGSIGGYTPGVDIKRRLLEIEYYSTLANRGR